MSQYMGNDEATREAFVNGWLRTGDIGYCQEKKWHIVGRLKVR
jgi:long-subunit acyl-CoA synthetase (AMP-forming)